jgi:hypothetical protein
VSYLLGGAFAPPIVIPLLIIGYLLSFLLANVADNQRANAGILLIGMTLLGWTFITVVIYGLAFEHQNRPSAEQVVFVKLIPWYTLWFVYSLAITMGAAHGTAMRLVRVALKSVKPLPPLPAQRDGPPGTTTVVAVTTARTNLESAQDTLESAQSTLDSAQATVQTAKTEHAFAEDHLNREELPSP